MRTMTTKMCVKTNWIYDQEMETLRILETCAQISKGFFQSKGFMVLPMDAKKNLIKFGSVLLPRWNYLGYKRFWKNTEKVKIEKNFPVKAPAKMVGFIKEQMELDKTFKQPPSNETIKEQWDLIQKDFWDLVSNQLKIDLSELTTLDIYLTRVGTKTTFKTVREKTPTKISLYLREDMNIYTLVASILLALSKKDTLDTMAGTWEESQFVVDWLMEHTKISEILSKVHPNGNHGSTTYLVKTKQTGKIKTISEKFLKEIGVPRVKFNFIVIGREIYVGKTALKGLTQKEKQILKLLVQKKGVPVTVDEIGTIIFVSTGKFSLYAISKTIQRLRDKLEKNGIAGAYIQTVRGTGFVLRG